MTNRVAVDKAVTVRSVNGPQFTFIQGRRPPGGDDATAMQYLVPDWTFDPESSSQLLRGGVEARTRVRHVVLPEEDEFVAALFERS